MTLLVACTIQASTLTQTAASSTATVSPVTPGIQTATPTQTTAENEAEKAQIRDLVENFGKRLGAVSLQAPDVAQEMQKQYADFVSPTLLEVWMNDVSQAPGRMVSSPWPDRIEITTLSMDGSDRYEITGYIIEITSIEVGSAEAAAKIPVRIVLQRAGTRWFITEYEQGISN
jgi:hypothetical protein